jgi:hypothetical protein
MQPNKSYGTLRYSVMLRTAGAVMLALASCTADSTIESDTGAAGSSSNVELTTQALQEGVALYEQCEPGGANLQGNCESGMVCQTIISGGFRCYLAASSSCPYDTKPYMGVACLETCDPIAPGEFCPFPLACNYGWCTAL